MANTADSWTNHPLYTPPEFWLQGLRTRDYERCMALLEDEGGLRKEVGRVLSRKQVALVVCRALNIDGGGTLTPLCQGSCRPPSHSVRGRAGAKW